MSDKKHICDNPELQVAAFWGIIDAMLPHLKNDVREKFERQLSRMIHKKIVSPIDFWK